MESPVKCAGLISVNVYLRSELLSESFIDAVVNLFMVFLFSNNVIHSKYIR